jgi:hypothetical protein
MNANPSLRPAARAGGLVLLVLLLLASGPHPIRRLKADSPAAPPSSRSGRVDVYAPDPQHLWNRLHRALCVRTARDGTEYGLDELDPLVAPESTHLLRGPGHRQALAVLDEFLAGNGEKQIADPLRRALLQRDLWAVFDQWADPPDPEDKTRQDLLRPTRALQKLLIQVIRRVALPAAQIEALPDNLAAALEARAYPAGYNPAQPEAPFLPPLRGAGDWVLLANEAGWLAPEHTRSFNGHSAFLVFLRLPGKRQETLDYLEKLRRFPNPRLATPGRPLNPALPQFPAGTQVALVRKMLLIDADGRLRPTRLTESVRLRVYRDVPPRGERPLPPSRQDAYEFDVRRKDLFAGKAGGLNPTGPEDAFADPFIRERVMRPPDVAWDPAEPPPTRQVAGGTMACGSCHGGCSDSGPGIFSVLSIAHAARLSDLGPAIAPDEKTPIPKELLPMAWKRQQYSWGLLQGMWETRLMIAPSPE